MATAQPPAAHSPAHQVRRGVQPLRAGEGSSFIWRKLHSLTGIVPIGAFLLEHILSNFEALKGPAAYAAQVKFLNGLPLVRVLEWTFIFIPILYHGAYGVYIWLRGRSNVSEYPWVGNWMYTLQRYTGLVAFAFIAWHFYTERILTGGQSTYHSVARDLHNPLYLAFFAVGILCSSFHLGVGIWNFLCKWDLAATARAQRAAGQLGAVVGITFSLVGLLILIGFRFDWHPFSSYLPK